MSKTICRVFGMPSHTFVDRVSGTDYVRVIQPLRFLDGYEDEDVSFDVTVYDHSKNKSFDWRDVFRDNDVIYFNYTTNDIGYAIMGLMAQKYNRKLICDIDDDLFDIQEDNPAYEAFKAGSWGRTVCKAIMGDVAHVTVTNSHLKHSMEFNTKAKGITVIPNYIDLKLYKHRSPFRDTHKIKAIYFGSTTHFNDLDSPPFVAAMDRIMRNFPNFTFQTIGAFIPKFRRRWGERYEQGFGHIDVLKWIEMMPKFMDQADFMVVPLVNNTYTRSKSSIKFLEGSSYKIPGVWQKIRQYNEVVKDGVNGFLASTEEEWYNAIVKLITDVELRRKMGEEAFKSIQPWQMKHHVKEYVDLFKNVLQI